MGRHEQMKALIRLLLLSSQLTLTPVLETITIPHVANGLTATSERVLRRV